MNYVYLIGAIIFEVVGTTLLKKTDGFSNYLFTGLMLGSYAISFFALSMAVKALPVSIVYATWSGVGIVLVSVAAYFLYKEKLDLAAILGMGLIISGVFIISFVSKTTAH